MGSGRKKRQSKIISEKFNLGKELGEGGNARVYEAINKDTKVSCAIKVLNDFDEIRAIRFSEEIRMMSLYSPQCVGVLPVIDKDEENLWYTMPISENVINHIRNKNGDVSTVVDIMLRICDTLSFLHSQGISHRDIKPDNLYILDGIPKIGDFGLVDFPDNNNNLTRNDRGLGAIFTIAPEMKRNPVGQDGKKADVYSLAKTLWMLLTLDEKGFDGQYNCCDDTHRLHHYNNLENAYLVEIERLLKSATDNEPMKRPTIEEFKEYLEQWQASNADGLKKQENEWHFLNDCLFDGQTPRSVVYDNLKDVIKTLNIVGQSPAYNHMMFSNGGGLDFTNVDFANEDSCLYLVNKPFISIVKPKCLYFESFPDVRWNYFLLEADEMKPIYAGADVLEEDLVEDTPGHYVPSTYVEYGVYDYDKGNKYPDGYKHVYRYCKGKFLIVLKTGPYNGINRTYDGRHGYCSNWELRDYIDSLSSTLAKLKQEGYDEDRVLNSDRFNANPFAERMPDREMLIDDEQLPNGREFVKKEFQNWNFKDILDSVDQGIGNLNYYIKVRVCDMGFIFSSYKSFLEQDFLYISADGSVRETVKCKMDTPFYIKGREQAKEILEKIQNKVYELCSGYDQSSILHSFTLNLRWVPAGKPSHLFTKKEIEKEMREADDRIANKLVIDDDGYAYVVPATENSRLYVVVHEAWGAFNRYVGKYSSLSVLDDFYNDSLACWLRYLQTGRYQFSNENEFCDEVAIVSEIKKYYDYSSGE